MSTVEYAATATRSALSLPVSTATLAEVDIRAELDARASRLPNYEQENRAFGVLTTAMATDPSNLLQKLVETAVELCDAETAGISLLDGDLLRWEAVAGVFVGARGGTLLRSESPCGICIERNSTQLMHLADRCFPALRAEPRFVEALLIPFHDRGKPIGTVWIVSHTIERKFDKEDERIVRVLAQFASVGWQLWQTSEPQSRDSSAGGLGLGLTLVRSLTERHGGPVRIVRAGPGQGNHASRPQGDGRASWLSAAEKRDAMSGTRIDPPSPQNRSLNNKLHRLLLVAPQQFAAVEAFVDEALDHALAPPLRRLPIGAR